MIPKLEDMTFAQRFGLTIAICLIILFALALFGYLTGGWDSADAEPVETSIYDERIADIDRKAIEAAYHDHIKALYSVWMRDATNPASPGRAGTGARLGRKALIEALTAVDKRYPGKQ